MAKEKQIPIRIGVNSGSLEKELVEKYGGVTPQGLVESALKHVHILEKLGFYDIVVSIKASDVPFSIEAYRLLSEAIPYPNSQKPARPMQARLNLLSASGRFLPWVSETRFVFL